MKLHGFLYNGPQTTLHSDFINKDPTDSMYEKNVNWKLTDLPVRACHWKLPPNCDL